MNFLVLLWMGGPWSTSSHRKVTLQCLLTDILDDIRPSTLQRLDEVVGHRGREALEVVIVGVKDSTT